MNDQNYTTSHTLTVDGLGTAQGSIGNISGLYTNNTGTGSAPGYYITDSTAGIDWSRISITSADSSNSLQVRGRAVFEDNIEFEGLDLGARLAKIEQRLGILHTRPELELRWDQLRALGDQYRALERQCLEQEKIVEILGK